MSSQLERSITQFTAWRSELVASIDEFKDSHTETDFEQTLHIYDLVEDLREDRILLALLGEPAASKIGLINALLFSDRPGGLLPSGPGCEYLCATEIYHDPSESPYVRALPMDTRKEQQSIGALRRNPVDWVNMRLDPDSPESVAEAMHSLIEPRTVSVEEAESLNLTDLERNGDEVSIPAWRYALINIPHPMLKSGLIALYSPSLHMLSAEPEVALRIASNAQSLLMVLGQELTPTARDFWKQYMQSSEAHKFVVLDSDAGAERGAVARVAQTLEIPSTRIFLMPVERAVGARLAQQVAEDGTAGGIEQIEQLHADEVVPDRQALLLASVAKEIGPAIQSARRSVAARFIATVREMLDLTSTTGKNRDKAQELLTQLETERKNYQKAVATFDVIYDNLMSKGEELVATLNDDRIEEILSHDRAFIQGAWTTTGMWNSMQKLFGYFTLQVVKIFNYSFKLRETVEGIYQNFHENFGLVKVSPPPLTLEKYVAAMKALEVNARNFCHDPVNIAKYKNYMLKSFYDGLVTEARRLFELTRSNTGHWVRGALGPLKDQIMERETLMLKRVENLRSLKDDHTSMQERLKQLNEERLSLKKQGDQLDQLRFDLDLPVPWAPIKPE